MRKAVFCTYLTVFLTSILFIVWVIPTFSPPFSGFGMPPSALPYTLCTIIAVFSLPILVREYPGKKRLFKNKKQKEDNRPNPLPLHKWAHLALFSIVFFSTMPLMQLIGFIPAAIIVLTVLQLFCGNLNPVKIALVSVLTSSIAWICMTYILSVPMP